MSKRTSIRIPDDLYSYLVVRAKDEQRTVSNLIVNLLTMAVKDTGSNTAALDEGDKPADIPD